MRLWKSRRWQRTGRGLIALALMMALIPVTAQARPLAADTITGNVTWNADRTLTTDVVIANGAKLTIQAVTITVQGPDAHPSPKSGSAEIEIIVDTGGTLIVKAGATLTAKTGTTWGGIAFREGSGGEVMSATIRNGVAGITVGKASPRIEGNYIADITGKDGDASEKDGSPAYAIAVIGPNSAKIVNNSIDGVYGGSGYPGADGADGSRPGDDGTDGGDGGNAFGIYLDGGGDYVVRGNTVMGVWGGNGERGGSGGDGGRATGIFVNGVSTAGEIRDNTVINIIGGAGGFNKYGGPGGLGYDGDASTAASPLA